MINRFLLDLVGGQPDIHKMRMANVASAHPGFILPKGILPRRPFKTCDPICVFLVFKRKHDPQLVVDNLASPIRDGMPKNLERDGTYVQNRIERRA